MSDEVLRGAQRTELGGLPAYVADVPGPTRAALLFRVGQADETLPRRGLTHLVEHLALGHFGRADAVGGAVDVLFTFAWVEGSPSEVVERLHEIASCFADPPTERIATERRILYAEDGDKAPHPASEVMAQLYGPRGPGLTAFKEFGLRHASAEDVCAHAKRWFSRENAALALTKPLPGLDDLPLRSGDAMRAQRTATLPLSPLPAEIALGNARMALGAPLRGGDAVSVLAALIERKAWSSLRHERGLAYDVECRAKAVGPHERLLCLTSDVGADDVGTAVKVAVDEIGRLAAGDFTDEDLEAAQADLRRRAAHNPLTILLGAATVELARGDVRQPAEILAGVDAVSRDDVAAVAGALGQHLIATLPEGQRSGALRFLDTTTHLIDGTRYERVRLPRDPEAGDVIVGIDGVSEISPSGHVTTVDFNKCVAAIREPGGVLSLVGERGQTVVVDPAEIKHGLQALTRVEASVPAELIVAAEDSTSEQDAAARAHRQEMERLRERVHALRSSGDEDSAKAAVAEAMRQHPDDEVVRQLERQMLGIGSTSTPARVTWDRGLGS